MNIKHIFKKPSAKVAAVSLLIIFILASYKAFSIYQQIHSHFQPPPDAITTANVIEMDWQASINVVGSLLPIQGVTVSAEEAGKIVKIGFESGQAVNKGDLLFQIDSSFEEGELLAAEAKVEQTQLSLKRMQNLWTKQVGSESDFNDAQANAKAAQGVLNSIRASIAHRTIVAEFSGRTGIRMVNLGQYVAAGTALVPLQSLQQLYLNFSIPQSKSAYINVGQSLHFHCDLFANQEFTAQITAIDPQLDANTRSVKVQAIVDNKDEKLKPGMFASVSVFTSAAEKVLVIPGSAISYAPYGNSVFIVSKLKGPDEKEYTGVTQNFIELGQAQGDLVAIKKGLKLGDEVATSGVFKLRPFAPVMINNAIKPGSELNPTPADT